MRAADLVLCRAGASTISELTALGVPAVIVPSPYVTNNHQEKNARVLEKAGGAAVVLEQDASGADPLPDRLRYFPTGTGAGGWSAPWRRWASGTPRSGSTGRFWICQ